MAYPYPVSRGLNRVVLSCVLGLMLAVAAGAPARAESLIRDDEIETVLKDWVRPVILADGLDPDSVKIILVQSPDINAFVSGGPNIFIYTGLLLKSENAGEIVGVLSHELGHIAGGHLIRGRDEMKNASFQSLLGGLAGIGAAILTGEGGAGAAVSAGMSSMAQNNYLSFSRVQESSADQAALSGMEKAHINPEGLVTFLQKMESQELLPASQQSKYIRTHPMTRDRIAAVRNGADKSAYKNTPLPAGWTEQHARLKAKLLAFITPAQVAWTYDDHDTSMAARYARAIAAYRQNQVQDSLRMMDGLLQAEPQNPYFLELKGQMLKDYGRVAEALPYYRKALDKAPDAGLIRIAYANGMLETAGNDRARLQQAAEQLRRAQRDEPRAPLIYRLLATAYGRMGQEAVAKVYLAEEAALKGDRKTARDMANAALPDLKTGSPEWLKARDLLSALKSEKDGADE